MVALCMTGRMREGDNLFMRGAKWLYAPVVRLAVRLRYVVVPVAIAPLLAPWCSLGAWDKSFSLPWMSMTCSSSLYGFQH